MAEQPSVTNQKSPPPEVEGEIREQTPQEVRKELREAIVGSNDILTTAKTTMTIFPDTVTVDRAKLTVTKRTFWRSAEVTSINVTDILNATATVGPIFGTVKVMSRILNSEKPYNIGLFWREDALRIKRVLQGYIIALERNIDCGKLSTKELSELLDKLGEDDHHTN